MKSLYEITGRIEDINTVLVPRQEFDGGLTKAARQALEALEAITYRIERDLEHDHDWAVVERELANEAIAALREALEHQVQAPVTLLPDGSAFAVMSYPLPKTHWLYAPREYEDGADEPKELPAPILTHAQRDSVIAAIRYAVRGATMCGKEMDFDPDALVQNAVYALCGPYVSDPKSTAMNRESYEDERRTQPLTDEQVWKSEEIMAVNAAVGLVMDDLMMLVRAVERTHGIGGEA